MFDPRRFFARGGRVQTIHRPERDRKPKPRPIEQPPAPPPPLPASALGFPKPFQYFIGTRGDGTPLMTSPGVFDPAYLDALARLPLITLNIAPFTNPGSPANLNVVSLLRARNPNMKILFYSSFQWIFQYLTPGVMWTDTWSLAKGTNPIGPDRTLYFDAAHGSGVYPFNSATAMFWDIGHAPGAGVAFANIWKAYAQGKADGYFLDTMVGAAGSWTAGVDWARAGYASLAALNAACIAESDAAVAALVGTGLIYGNRGGLGWTPHTTGWTGELIETWDPDWGQNGGNTPGKGALGNFDACMNAICAWRGPSPDSDGTILIKSENGDNAYGSTSSPGDLTWNKELRYCLACATIAGGYHFMGKKDGSDPTGVFWWADEWGVNPLTGVPDPAHTGWLGRPIEYGYRDSSGVWVRRFERGIVIVNGPGAANTIDMGKPYKRLLGTQAPTINTGVVEQVATLASKDGRFYVNA